MVTYAEIIPEVNKICDPVCIKIPKKSCPYYDICTMPLHGSDSERAAEFESAIVARYLEINNKN